LLWVDDGIDDVVYLVCFVPLGLERRYGQKQGKESTFEILCDKFVCDLHD
jgi:hypothetical protein